MEDQFRLAPEAESPQWARNKTLRRLKESTDRYLNHLSIRPIVIPAAIAKELLLPSAEAFGLVPVFSPLRPINVSNITIGMEPSVGEWDANHRYDMPFLCHDRLSALGLVASSEHEREHAMDVVSFGGLPILLATETQIASYKPICWDLADLRKRTNQTIGRLGPITGHRWKELTIQLETFPSLVHHSFLTSRDVCMKDIGFFKKGEFTEFASEAARPELGDLFMEVLEKPRNRTHLEALKLGFEVSSLGLEISEAGRTAFYFVKDATCLGFLGRDCLLNLARKYGERYKRAHLADLQEESLAILFEALGLTSLEYHQVLLKDLDGAASATRGWAAKRLTVLKNGADFAMRASPIVHDPCLGFVVCYLIELGAVPVINVGGGYSKERQFMNSEVEAMLSFYVDWGLAQKMEGPVEKHEEARAIGEEKPAKKTLTCPLFGAVQPPWCPGCSGRLKYTLEKGVIMYEADDGLNQNCPIIKEWLGEKNLRPSKSS